MVETTKTREGVKMEFELLKQKLQENFKQMTKGVTHIFEVDLDKDVLWDLYLDSFPPGTNEIFRERREYDCSCCRQFIRNIGNAVVIKDCQLKTVWDFGVGDETFQTVLDSLDTFVRSHEVTDVWLSDTRKVGTDKNHELSGDGSVITWDHFYLEVPKSYVVTGSKSIESVQGEYRDKRNVLKRSLDELTTESVEILLELIDQNSLYKGEEWKSILGQFLELKKEYEGLENSVVKDLFSWERSVKIGMSLAKIRNSSIGTLLVDLSEGVVLDTAVRKYESVTAPSNYKRPKAIYSKKMLEDAQKKVEELNYLESLNRRHATLDDISVNNILFSNKDSARRIQGGSLFDELSSDLPVDPKKFSKVEEIGIEDFVRNVLPTARELEVLLENRHTGNFVSLIAPENKDSENMFKWNNRFSWAYTGNITDSMKERVKSLGGSVDGVLRFSIQWNDGDTWDNNDLDAHCVEPKGYMIYYPNKGTLSPTGGVLDVDIINPEQGKPAVENITWKNTSKMSYGTYKFFVNPFSNRGGRGGFRAEVEFGGNIYPFDYSKDVGRDKIAVCEVTYNSEGFHLKELLQSTVSSRDVWGLKTNQFVPVSTVMYSPNYWDSQNGIGHRHYFFMLKDCVNSESPNGFYNEFLNNELTPHRKVFEALGSKMAVKVVDDQLSGVGFSSTKRSSVMVKVKGVSERVLNVKF